MRPGRLGHSRRYVLSTFGPAEELPARAVVDLDEVLTQTWPLPGALPRCGPAAAGCPSALDHRAELLGPPGVLGGSLPWTTYSRFVFGPVSTVLSRQVKDCVCAVPTMDGAKPDASSGRRMLWLPDSGPRRAARGRCSVAHPPPAGDMLRQGLAGVRRATTLEGSAAVVAWPASASVAPPRRKHVQCLNKGV